MRTCSPDRLRLQRVCPWPGDANPLGVGAAGVASRSPDGSAVGSDDVQVGTVEVEDPAGFVHDVVVTVAEQHEVVGRGRATVDPVRTWCASHQPGGRPQPGNRQPCVADDDRPPQRWWHRPPRPADVEWLATRGRSRPGRPSSRRAASRTSSGWIGPVNSPSDRPSRPSVRVVPVEHERDARARGRSPSPTDVGERDLADPHERGRGALRQRTGIVVGRAGRCTRAARS